MKIRFARQEDIAEIKNLLRENKLPVSDIGKTKIVFLLAENKEMIAGCIGLEQCGKEGLLRSFVVGAPYRSEGIGARLYHSFLGYCKNSGVERLHLLTDTAENYFAGRGFQKRERTTAPESILALSEFSELCPSTSSYMVLDDLNCQPSYYPDILHLMQKEKESQSLYWSIHGAHQMLTYFEVPPHREFAEHAHESEQITFVLEGELCFEIEGAVHCLDKGDSIVIPSNMKHRVWTSGAGARAVDSWSPVNEKLKIKH